MEVLLGKMKAALIDKNQKIDDLKNQLQAAQVCIVTFYKIATSSFFFFFNCVLLLISPLMSIF